MSLHDSHAEISTTRCSSKNTGKALEDLSYYRNTAMNSILPWDALKLLGYVQLLSFVLLAYIVVTAVQRRYFSPISDIPGPFLASVSNFWQIWQIAMGHTAESTIKLHEKYGMAPVRGAGHYRHVLSSYQVPLSGSVTRKSASTILMPFARSFLLLFGR